MNHWRIRVGPGLVEPDMSDNTVFLTKNGTVGEFATRDEALAASREYNRRHGKGASYVAECESTGRLSESYLLQEQNAAEYIIRTFENVPRAKFTIRQGGDS